jgi:hypothetical protein
MRKPLLLICAVCCLLFSATSLLASAESPDELWNQDSPAIWDVGSWLYPAQLFHLPFLNSPITSLIFNDGPDPVGTSEKEEGGNPENESESGEASDGGPTPMESMVNPNLNGERD